MYSEFDNDASLSPHYCLSDFLREFSRLFEFVFVLALSVLVCMRARNLSYAICFLVVQNVELRMCLSSFFILYVSFFIL